jgi:hypothetical protein
VSTTSREKVEVEAGNQKTRTGISQQVHEPKLRSIPPDQRPRPSSPQRVRGMSVSAANALFSLQNFWFLATVALSFLFDKYYPIKE